MPSKKKKYNARFPPARIKKIMQTDEDVGKVAAAVPVIISRALELFIDSLMEKTAAITKAKNAKTLSASHIKQAIHSEKTFDFLRSLVQNVPDHQTEEEMEGAGPSGSGIPEKKPKISRPKKEGSRGPGRPRKVKMEEAKTSVSESDEETETDEEQKSDCDASESDTAGAQSNPGQGSVDQGPSASLPGHQGDPAPVVSQLQTGNHVGAISQSEQQPQSQGQPAVAQIPSSVFPMHNIPFQQYPYTMGQPQTMNMQPFMHPQMGTSPSFSPAGVPVQPYPTQFIPDQQHLLVPQMSPNGPLLNMMAGMAPSAMHTGVPQSGLPATSPPNKEANDANTPLDMSISSKQRSQETSSSQTTNTVTLSQIPVPRNIPNFIANPVGQGFPTLSQGSPQGQGSMNNPTGLSVASPAGIPIVSQTYSSLGSVGMPFPMSPVGPQGFVPSGGVAQFPINPVFGDVRMNPGFLPQSPSLVSNPPSNSFGHQAKPHSEVIQQVHENSAVTNNSAKNLTKSDNNSDHSKDSKVNNIVKEPIKDENEPPSVEDKTSGAKTVSYQGLANLMQQKAVNSKDDDDYDS